MAPGLGELLRSVRSKAKWLADLGHWFGSDPGTVLKERHDPGWTADLLAPCLVLRVEEAQEFLEIRDPIERLRRTDRRLEELIRVELRFPRPPPVDWTKDRAEIVAKLRAHWAAVLGRRARG